MKNLLLVACYSFCMTTCIVAQNKVIKPVNDRALWLSFMDKIARPVLSNLAEDKLKEEMPVALSKRIDNPDHRSKVAYLEAFGRTLSGIAPWLNMEGGSKEEADLRNQY